MGFADIVRKTWQENVLFSVLVELTYRCNLNCFFCYNDLGLRGRAMSREQYFELFEDLARMQVMSLALSGGEPLAHPDFLALGRRARELGFAVRLKTNGHALRGRLLAEVRDEVDPFLVEISLHGARAATHDRQTRVPGSFDRLMANLDEIREAGLRLRINCTLTRWNEAELEEIFALARDRGLPLHVDPIVTPRDDGDAGPLEIGASRAAVGRLFALQRGAGSGEVAVGRQADEDLPPVPSKPEPHGGFGTKHSATKHCGAGSAGLAIDPYGNVYPCVQWRRPVGNLHEASIESIWTGSHTLDEIRDATAEVHERFGDAGRQMAFCPGQAVLETGDHLGIYDGARLRADLTAEVAGRGTLPVVT